MTAAHQIQCPSCGDTIAIKAAGYTVTVACQYCGSILDVSNLDVRLITEYHEAIRRLPLPLGSDTASPPNKRSTVSMLCHMTSCRCR